MVRGRRCHARRLPRRAGRRKLGASPQTLEIGYWIHVAFLRQGLATRVAATLTDAGVGGELDRHYKRSFYKGDDDLVFCHPQTGDPYHDSQIRKRFYEAMTAAKMGHRCGREGGITFHSLRHTFGTRMAAAGVPMRTLQEWMGHRNLATTEIYADYAPDPAYGAKFAEDAFTAKPTEETEDGEQQDAAVTDESDLDEAA
jgi:integrase